MRRYAKCINWFQFTIDILKASIQLISFRFLRIQLMARGFFFSLKFFIFHFATTRHVSLICDRLICNAIK